MLHPVHISHEGFSEIRKVPFAEVAQGEFPQPLRQAQTGRLDLTVHQTVGGPVLLQVGHKGQQDKPHGQDCWQHRPRQRRTVRQGVHKGPHQQIQDTHSTHNHQVCDDSPKCACLGILQKMRLSWYSSGPGRSGHICAEIFC